MMFMHLKLVIIKMSKVKYVELQKFYYTYLSELLVNIVESILEESMETINSKEVHLEEKYKLIGEMEEKIQLLQNALHEIKVCIWYSLATIFIVPSTTFCLNTFILHFRLGFKFYELQCVHILYLNIKSIHGLNILT